MGNKKEIKNEADTKADIIALARQQGVEEKVAKLWDKFTILARNAKDDKERQQIAILGLAEIHKTIGCVGPLIVDGIEVIPENLAYRDDILLHKGIVKLD